MEDKMADISNEELVRKAVITADALATNGKLNPAQSDKFLDYVIDETTLRNNARIVRFRNESLDIDKIGIGTRLAVPKAEARDPGVRRGVTTSKITLTPSEIMVPIEIGDNFREINIEGENVEDHVIQMMGTQTANDIEELYINGNKLGPACLESDIVEGGSDTLYIKDSYLALQKGWLALGDSGHIVDGEGANIGLTLFGKALRAMPTKFRRNRMALRWFMSPDLSQIYFEKLATRATALGDAAAGGAAHGPFGIPISEVPLWSFLPTVVEHIVLTGTTPTPLTYGPVQNVVVTPSTLSSTPIAAYIEDTNYTVDYAAGTVVRVGGGIGSGATVKVTYKSNPQLMLTHMNNFVVGVGRDVRIEKDRDIFKGVNQYAITAKVAVEIEEVDALVKVRNIGQN
jgi:hypothetical protein